MQTLRQKSQLFPSRTISCEVGLCVPGCRTLLLGRPHGPRPSHLHQSITINLRGGLWPHQIIQNKSPALLKQPFPSLSSDRPPFPPVKCPSPTPHRLSFLSCPAWSSRARKSTPSTTKSITTPSTSRRTANLTDQRTNHRRGTTGSQDAHADYHWVCYIVLLLLAISFTLWHFQTLAVQCSETPRSQAAGSDDTFFCLWPTTAIGPDVNRRKLKNRRHESSLHLLWGYLDKHRKPPQLSWHKRIHHTDWAAAKYS